METFFLGLLGLQSGNLKLLEILIGVPLLVFELPEYISTPHLQRFLEYGLLFKGLFARCLWMITTLCEFQSVIYSGQAGLTLDNVIALLATIHACNEFCAVLTYSQLLVSQKIFFPLNFTFAANSRFIFLLNDIIIKLQTSTCRYVG